MILNYPQRTFKYFSFMFVFVEFIVTSIICDLIGQILNALFKIQITNAFFGLLSF